MTTRLLERLRVDARFNGPDGSANGGYICGLMAQAIGEEVGVRLYQPIPLDTDMELVFDTVTSKWQLKLGEQLIAAAHPTKVHAHLPVQVPGYEGALQASQYYAGFTHHPCPNCFVCGTARQMGDGLRIFAGRLSHSNMVAAPWLPAADLADASGCVLTPYLWAALDCPGVFASVPAGRFALLGEIAVQIRRPVRAEEPCVIVGWPILIEGRKHKVGTALYDQQGEQRALGVATWIELAM